MSRWTVLCALLSGAGLYGVLRAEATLAGHPRVQALAMLALLVGATAALALTVARGRWRVPAAALLAALLFALMVDLRIRHVERTYTTDAVAFTHHAALLWLDGTNPYRAKLWPGANERFGMPLYIHTRRTDGGPETGYSYPAGALLLMAGPARAGLSDMRYLVAAFLLLSALLLGFSLEGEDRVAPWLLLALYPLASELTVGSVIDPLWLPFVLGAWLLSDRRPLVGALLFGLALAIKQQSWLLFPFFLVAAGRLGSWRTAVQGTLGAAAVFAAVNGWFLLDDPAAWWDGTTLPFAHPLVAEGVGLVQLERAGLIGPLARWHYLTLAGGLYAGLLAAYWRWFDRLGPLGPVLGLLPVALSTRSHMASLYLLPLLLLCGVRLAQPSRPRHVSEQ